MEAADAVVLSSGCDCGLGAAFRSGVADALENEADIPVTVDGDGQFDIRQIPELIGPILDGRQEQFIKLLTFIVSFFVGMAVLLALFGRLARVAHRNQFPLARILYELKAHGRRKSDP